MKITFLGTGTSHGVPSLDCMINNYVSCPQNVCILSQSDPHHNRTRSSILLENRDKTILIDPSADFRQQALRENIKKIDAVLVTHPHADHISGIPDIRSYTTKTSLPLYGSSHTINAIRSTFNYVFDNNTFIGGGIPQIDTVAIDNSAIIQSLKVIPINVAHGKLQGCYGYRIESMAYIPDIKSISDTELEKLHNLDILILNCLRRNKEHCSHLIVSESIELARKIQPKHCYFIHMSHDIHYKHDSDLLDTWMTFSHDGLTIYC